MGSENEGADAKSSRVGLLLAFFQTAHEHLLHRVKQREEWIKLHLLSQVGIVALSNGIPMFNVQPSAPAAWVAILALPLSTLFLLLYIVEDRLVKHLANYMSGLPKLETSIVREPPMIPNFDSSNDLQDFYRYSLSYRVWAQILIFILIPYCVVGATQISVFTNIDAKRFPGWVWIGVSVLALVNLVLVKMNEQFRKHGVPVPSATYDPSSAAK